MQANTEKCEFSIFFGFLSSTILSTNKRLVPTILHICHQSSKWQWFVGSLLKFPLMLPIKCNHSKVFFPVFVLLKTLPKISKWINQKFQVAARQIQSFYLRRRPFYKRVRNQVAIMFRVYLHGAKSRVKRKCAYLWTCRTVFILLCVAHILCTSNLQIWSNHNLIFLKKRPKSVIRPLTTRYWRFIKTYFSLVSKK